MGSRPKTPKRKSQARPGAPSSSSSRAPGREPPAASAQPTSGAPAPLAPSRRLGLLLLAWAVVLAAGPGALTQDGSLLAFLGLGLWAYAAHRPGRRALLVETLAGAFHGGVTMYWVAHVWEPTVVWVGLGWGLYIALAGWVLRRLHRRLPLALSAAVAFTSVEALRALIPPPFGMRWLQLGHHAASTPILAEGARLLGPTGLTFVLAALGGLAAELFLARRALRSLPRGSLAFGLGPLALACGYALLSSPPPMEPGPRLLLVQPAFPQWRKQQSSDIREKFVEQLELTSSALRAIEAEGRPAPDLVSWGETMLYVHLIDDSLAGADLAALEIRPWWQLSSEELPEVLADRRLHEQRWVDETLFGVGPRGARLLPEGTSFVSGAEAFVALDGRLERMNVVALWNADGVRGELAGKQHLAPGGETMLGLERIGAVRDYIMDVAGYVPDFLPAARTGVLELEARDGRRYRFGATVCFDNAFIRPYTEPLRRGPLDFHLVVSNEAWYLDSFEMDQMVAFSRLLAIATGRSVVRATNSGVTIALGPDGSELRRLRVDGRDRHLPGTLEVHVPVPAGEGASAARTPYVRIEPWLEPAWVLLGVMFLALGVLRGGYRRASAG